MVDFGEIFIKHFVSSGYLHGHVIGETLQCTLLTDNIDIYVYKEQNLKCFSEHNCNFIIVLENLSLFRGFYLYFFILSFFFNKRTFLKEQNFKKYKHNAYFMLVIKNISIKPVLTTKNLLKIQNLGLQRGIKIN